MRYALSPHSLGRVREFAASPALLAFDFDGTLAPIVDDPKRAGMRPATRSLLSRLASVRTCLILSGRSRADLRGKLAGTGLRHLIGNHGAELSEAHRIDKQVLQWQTALAKELSWVPGLKIENKALSLTVHYRQCRRKAEALSAILRVAGSLPEARLVGGKDAVSIVSPGAPHKGAALRAGLTRLGYRRALYVGDDETDEDVFGMTGFPLLTISVGPRVSYRASYFLRSQPEIDNLLRILLESASRRRPPV